MNQPMFKEISYIDTRLFNKNISRNYSIKTTRPNRKVFENKILSSVFYCYFFHNTYYIQIRPIKTLMQKGND